MTVQVGDSLPAATLWYAAPHPNEPNVCAAPEAIKTNEYFKGKKVVIFAVPGAFTPTCHVTHLPGFINKAEEIKGKGVDAIVCLCTDDVFVMEAWGKATQNGDKLMMVSDGNSEFVKALGLTQDLTRAGLGPNRAQRFALVVDDLKVTYVGVESGGDVTVSGADAVLSKL
ncbi:Redoxin [Piptocephalis cylindrospora]|uniref:Thioredoxin-dependent peroxiredoxin n=1 Tax=Piptocephalis cylindrospora TaxID=1907219 RepID=A0A4P9YAD2_9FUNG|nr:Redoxin [Piptocephalis cylindrospora]|eukprot:RKP15441.1 Redoxin [Piptocephalis cylindrospora]